MARRRRKKKRLAAQASTRVASCSKRHRSYQRVRRRWIQRYGWEPYYRLGPHLEMWGVKREKEMWGWGVRREKLSVSPRAFRRPLR